MSESIFYKFASMKAFSKLPITTDSMPLWEVRSEIVKQLRIEPFDCELLFYEHDLLILDEYFVIHKNSQLLIKRVPPIIGKLLKQNEKIEAEAVIHAKNNDLEIINRDSKNSAKNSANCKCKNNKHILTCKYKSESSNLIQRLRGVPKDFIKNVDKSDNEQFFETAKGNVKIEPQTKIWEQKKTVFSLDSLKCKECGYVCCEYGFSSCGHIFCAECLRLKIYCCNKRVQRSKNEDVLRKRFLKQLEGG